MTGSTEEPVSTAPSSPDRSYALDGTTSTGPVLLMGFEPGALSQQGITTARGSVPVDVFSQRERDCP